MWRTSRSIAEKITATGPLWVKEAATNGSNRVSFFSQLQGMKISDREGIAVGKLSDLAIRPGDTLLEISRIVYTSNILREKVILPISSVGSINGDIRLDVSRDEIPPGRLSEDELLVTETILDRQIVDIDGLKVVRVNDILLGQVKRSLCLVGVDVGFKGIIRRLGFSGLSGSLMAKLPNRIVPWSYIDPLDPNLRSLHLKISRKTINDLHPADIADILEELNNKDRLLILDSLEEETAAETMEEVDPEVQATMVNQMESDDVADILENMNPDDAADLLGIMPENKASEVLELMNEEEAEEVRELMGYSESSAGSLMTTDYVAVPSGCTVSNIFSILRRSGQEVDMIYYIYVQSDSGQLLGVMSLRDLILAEPDDIASTVMKKEVLSVLPTSTIEEVTNLLSKYDFLCIPVVDEVGRILGIVTFDDALDEIIPEDLRKRMPWNYHKLRRVRGMD